MQPDASTPVSPASDAAPPPAGPAVSGLGARLRARHFHDYSDAALQLWLLVAFAGALALVFALTGVLSAAHAPDWRHLLAGLLLVGAAAWYPIEIPRTRYSIGAGDLFIFTLLAVLGAPAAVLASGLEGLIGTWRSTKRLSSRVSTPAIGMAAMAVAGLAFEALTAQLSRWGVDRAAAAAFALLPASLIPFAITSYVLTAIVTLKQDQWPSPWDALGELAWLAVMSLAAALMAGLVQLEADRQGPVVLIIGAVATLGIVMLMRMSLARREAEHREQEGRISAARREAERNQQRFAAAFTHAAIGMAIVDGDGDVVQANQALGDLLGRGPESLIGQPFVDALRPHDVALLDWWSRAAAEREGGQSLTVELPCTRQDGSEVWVQLHCGRFESPGVAGNGLIYQVQDITSRQLAESRLQHIAFHDSLTDLPNRAHFHEQLGRAVTESQTEPERRFAVLFLDLDRFKLVNDSLGHMLGNDLLREVARRLQQCVRPSDLVARLGGDEFAILLRDIRDHADGVRLAERMLAALSAPMSLGGTDIVTAASVGLTFSDLAERSVDETLRDADLAMYEAKAAGRGRVAVFDRTMHEQIADKLALDADLRHALGEGDLSLDFQPLFELEPTRLFGFEALARWTHPERGPISPHVFVALAEESGRIGALTDWVVDRALAQLAAWHREAPHMAHLGVSVNISGSDLVRADFVPRVLERLQRHAVSADRLTLEITETVLMSNLEPARDALTQLRHSGVKLAIDDFGTGYSSLAYLSRLPIDYLKIDRSFVCALTSGDEHVEIVRAVMTLGVALGQCVVAEGIETPEQLAALRRLGVTVGQGYLMSRPLNPAQVSALL